MKELHEELLKLDTLVKAGCMTEPEFYEEVAAAYAAFVGSMTDRDKEWVRHLLADKE